jgi:hypothetical protein
MGRLDWPLAYARIMGAEKQLRCDRFQDICPDGF